MKNTVIKYCGFTNEEDVNYALQLNIEYIGFIFTKKSPRCVSLDMAKRLSELCKNNLMTVGVFMDQSSDYINEVITKTNIQFLQFHGHESEEFCLQFGKPYIKTLHASNSLKNMNFEIFSKAHAILLDTKDENDAGGTGKIFNWNILSQDHTIESLETNIIVAGGLNPTNVGGLVSTYKPWGIDVSSGIESSIGKKDHTKMKEFIDNIDLSN